MRVRKLLIGAIATVTAVVVGAVGADFGAAIYAEYRLARSVRAAANLNFDPSVGILGFPFVTAGDAPPLRRGRDQGQWR